MSDQTNAAAFQPVPGQEQVPVAEQPQPEAAAQQTPLTLEQVQALVKEAEERAFRRAQGLFDKGREKYTAGLKQLEDQLQQLRTAGVQVTPEQESKLRVQVYEQAYQADAGTPPQAGVPSPAGEQAQQPPDPITAEAWRLMEQAGTAIEEGDPEMAMLDQTGPYKFLQSVERAIQAKQARLAQTPGQPTGNAQARTPTNLGAHGQTANSILSENDPDRLISQGLGLS